MGVCRAEPDYFTDPSQCDPACSGGNVCCCLPKEGGVTIDVPEDDTGWIQKLFGDSIKLDIFKPFNLWEGEGTIFSYVAMIISNGFVLLFILFIIAVAVGTLKMISSQGDSGKFESAKKWFTNAVTGMVVTMVIFVVLNIGTALLGFGNIFRLASEFSVCDGKALYQYKKDRFEALNIENKQYPNLTLLYDCTCESGGWSCTMSP